MANVHVLLKESNYILFSFSLFQCFSISFPSSLFSLSFFLPYFAFPSLLFPSRKACEQFINAHGDHSELDPLSWASPATLTIQQWDAIIYYHYTMVGCLSCTPQPFPQEALGG